MIQRKEPDEKEKQRMIGEEGKRQKKSYNNSVGVLSG